jgi:hypothetical protein
VGYRFRGFFSDGDDAAMAAALDRWPFCTAKATADPFRGFGLRAPDPDSEADSDEEYERLVGLPLAVERGLADFSRRFPTSTFVFIDADCVGGTCVYTGFVAQAGEVRLRVEEVRPGPEPLQRLVAALGVRLQSGHFAPLARGFW